jgi:hypothetical protein
VQGNRDLFLNAVNWLAQQENLIRHPPARSAGSPHHADGGSAAEFVHHHRLIVPGWSCSRASDLVAEALAAADTRRPECRMPNAECQCSR